MKNQISKVQLQLTVGFIYWINEQQNLRGLKGISITEYPNKLEELLKEYNAKYPNGLTGFSN